MMNIVLFGAPGCGKGTQAQRLKEHYGIEHVSTGEVIRSEIRRGTELGRSMEHYISTGQLAPDEVVIGMIAIQVPEEELVRRILLRGKDSGRADDASEEVIRDRLSVYHKQTAIVSDFYTARNKYASIDGVGSMDEVFGRIAAIIDSL